MSPIRQRVPAARSSTRSAKARVSCASPGVRTRASGRPRASQRRCSLVENPPRERPSAWPCCPPWRRPRAGARGPWCCRASARAPRPRRSRPGRRTPPRTRPGRASARTGARRCSTSRSAPGPPASGRPRGLATGCRPGIGRFSCSAGPAARSGDSSGPTSSHSASQTSSPGRCQPLRSCAPSAGRTRKAANSAASRVPLGAPPPADPAPVGARQHGFGRDRGLARHGMPARPPGGRRRPVQLDRGRVDVLGLQDAHRPGEAARAQALAEGGAHPVAGVGQHAAEAHAGGDDPVDLRQRDLGLGQGAAVLLRHAGVGAAIRVGGPLVRQEQPEPERHRHLVLGQGERDQDLAVGLLAQGPAVLAGDADRALALLRQGGVVDHQHRARAADKRVRLPGQDPLAEGASSQAGLAMKCCSWSWPAQPEAGRERLQALAAVRTEQAVQVQGRPAPPRLGLAIPGTAPARRPGPPRSRRLGLPPPLLPAVAARGEMGSLTALQTAQVVLVASRRGFGAAIQLWTGTGDRSGTVRLSALPQVNGCRILRFLPCSKK